MVARCAGDQPSMYPVRLALQYKSFSRNRELVAVGRGHTVSIGSHWIVFDCEGGVPRNDRLELLVTWPVLLDHRVKLQLVVDGRRMAVNGNQVTLRVSKYEFRTRGPLFEVSKSEPPVTRSRAHFEVLAMHA